FAGSRLDPASGERGFEIAVGCRISDCGKARTKLARERSEGSRAFVGAHGLHAKAFALALEQVDGARADRAGSAQQLHGAVRRRRSLPRGTRWVGLHRLTTPTDRDPAPRSPRAPIRSAPPPRWQSRSRRGGPSVRRVRG